MYIPCSLSLQLRLVFCYPPSASLVVPFTVPSLPCLSIGLLLVLSLFGGSVVFRAWIFTSTSDWRLKFRLLPDKMFGRHGTHPTLVQKGAFPLLQVSCVCRVVGFGVLRAAQRGQVFVEGGLA